MSLATMADRSLPLAERVASALAAAARGIRSDEIASISELVADVAAADRLARAALVVADHKGMRMELTRRIDIGDTTSLVYDADAWYQAGEEYKTALDAYRARMQGVGA